MSLQKTRNTSCIKASKNVSNTVGKWTSTLTPVESNFLKKNGMTRPCVNCFPALFLSKIDTVADTKISAQVSSCLLNELASQAPDITINSEALSSLTLIGRFWSPTEPSTKPYFFQQMQISWDWNRKRKKEDTQHNQFPNWLSLFSSHFRGGNKTHSYRVWPL